MDVHELLTQEIKSEAAPPLPPIAPQEPPERPKRAKSHKVKWLIAAGVGVLVAVAAYYYARGSAGPEYTTVAVDRGTIVAGVTATGNVNAVKTVQVGSQVSGNILALYADFNTKVKEGQLVAKIDPAIFQARVDQASATLESAKAAVVNAQAGVKRAEADIANAEANVVSQQAEVVKAESAVTDAKTKNARRVELVKQGIIAQEDADTAQSTYDQAVASLDAAKAAVKAAQSNVEAIKAARDAAKTLLDSTAANVNQAIASLKQSQLDLAHTSILAPVDGTVISRNMDVGQTVAASFQAPTIFQIAQDLTKMEVDTNVDESDIAPIRVGQTATFTVDAYPGSPFRGEVREIRQAPINVQNVITYNVVIAVSNPDLKLLPGMTANVRIVTGRADQALRIPLAAVRFRPPTLAPAQQSGRGKNPAAGGRARTSATQTIYVLEGKQPKPVTVQTGLSDGNFLEILSGLNEGQPVIVGSSGKAGTAQPSQQQQPSPAGRRFGI
jgi:HlyD family secretion protein